MERNNFKDIHIGESIKKRMFEHGVDLQRVCNFFKLNDTEVVAMFQQEVLDTGNLLKWSKILEYDFFRLYSQHLIIYSPPSANKIKVSVLPNFRKNIYTQDLIDYIIESLDSGEKTKRQIMTDYRIPKTTLYKWIVKYGKDE